MVHPGNQDPLERDENHETLAKNVVVQCAEELGGEKRGEPALTE